MSTSAERSPSPGPVPGPVPGLVLRRTDLDDPVAVRLTEEVQQEYVTRYGGPDEAAVDPAEFVPPEGLFLVAEIDGELAGYAKLIFGTLEPGVTAEKPVELSRLYSHQKFLGQGVGQALMDACFERAKQAACDVMWLGVWEYNPRAKAFYEKYGFHEVGKHIFQLGSDPQTDVLMQREL